MSGTMFRLTVAILFAGAFTAIFAIRQAAGPQQPEITDSISPVNVATPPIGDSPEAAGPRAPSAGPDDSSVAVGTTSVRTTIGTSDVQGFGPKSVSATASVPGSSQITSTNKFVDNPGRQVLESEILTIFHGSSDNIAEFGPWVDGKREGYWESYSPEGRLTMAGVYLGGVAEGSWSAWYADGTKRFKGGIVEGEFDGPVLFWTPSGEVDNEKSGTYERGVLRKDNLK